MENMLYVFYWGRVNRIGCLQWGGKVSSWYRREKIYFLQLLHFEPYGHITYSKNKCSLILLNIPFNFFKFWYMQILIIEDILTLVSRWSHAELITRRTTRYKNDKGIKEMLGGREGMESGENSFKGKRQENILATKRNIGVILLLEIYIIYLLVPHYLLLVKNNKSHQLNQKHQQGFSLD